MANYYDDQLSRMSQLMFYKANSGDQKSQYSSIMNMKEGADGRVYGIVSEGTKYYIKSCPKGKENLVESFDYIGGFINRKDCMYSSYADAVKDMDMRLMSLNEDYKRNLPINEAKNSYNFMDRSMNEMREDIARHRQILENIDAVYQGGKGISDKNIGVPEAPKTQDFNTKVGDPFGDTAKYEENRDNKETAKDHEKQGGPFEEETEYEENTDNIQRKDSNTPGDTYTKKPEYVPNNAVAAMHPGGGEVVRVKMNEAYDEETHFQEENPDLAAVEVGELGDHTDEISPEDMEGILMPDESLEADALLAKFNDDPNEASENFGKPIAPESDKKAFETLGDDSDNQIAGIDDMSGVDRNNLSADIIDKVTTEAVSRFAKNKKLNMISESVAESILREKEEKERKYPTKVQRRDGEKGKNSPYFSDSDPFMNTGVNGDDLYVNGDFSYHTEFPYGANEEEPDKDKYPSRRSGRTWYFQNTTPAQSIPNVLPDGSYMDPRGQYELKTDTMLDPPERVFPQNYQYDPNAVDDEGNSMYLQRKYHFDLDDETLGNTIKDHMRQFNTSMARAQHALKLSDGLVSRITSVYEESARVAIRGVRSICTKTGIKPLTLLDMISSKTASGEKMSLHIPDENGEMVKSKYGYSDAVKFPLCIITSDGELPLSEGEGVERYTTRNGWVIVDGLGVIGPSLKAFGIEDIDMEELKKLAEWCEDWEASFSEALETQEAKMKRMTPAVQGLADLPNAQYSSDVKKVITMWNNWAETIPGLISAIYSIEEAVDKREMADTAMDWDRSSYQKDLDRGGYETVARAGIGKTTSGGMGLFEETTVLHNFGDHPGYGREPMTTPVEYELELNGSHDWNDDSAKGKKPFGKKIGSSAPYEKVVNAVTKEVFKTLQGGLE